MEQTIMQEFIDCLKNNPKHAYDFISNNYHKFSKTELVDIIKELIYAIDPVNYLIESEFKQITAMVADELTEQYTED